MNTYDKLRICLYHYPESDFLQSLMSYLLYRDTLTDKQMEALDKIFEKVH